MKHKLFIFLLALVVSVGTMNAAQLWPILMDGQTYNNLKQFVVSDLRCNDAENQLHIWGGSEFTYTVNDATGLNSFGNDKGYLSLTVSSYGWAGFGFYIDNQTSLSGLQSLKEAIATNPDNYYLHLSTKSTDSDSHCFYIMGNEATKFVLGSRPVYDGPIYGDFARDGVWYEFYIPLAQYASALAATDISSGIYVFSALSEGITGAQLNLDAVYFCDKDMKDSLLISGKPEEITNEQCTDSITWNLTDGVLTISGTGVMTDFNDWGNYAPWYLSRSVITSVVIEEGVTSIGNRAFEGCSNLISVSIPNSVIKVGEYAFNNCSSLPVVDNVRYADTYLVEAVDKTLSSYAIKAGTKWIGDWAFHDCKNLTTVTIPDNVISIGKEAFSWCENLTSVTISNSVTSIGEKAFHFCRDLSSLIIPNSVTSIGEEAFSWCENLTSVTIPNSVTSIGEKTFFSCRNLSSVTFPNSVASVGDWIFGGCSSLTEPIYNNHVFAYMPTSYTGAYFIPSGIECIAGRAFDGCYNLTSVTIPNSVTNIGEKAFNSVPNIIYNGIATGSPWGARSMNGYVDGYLVYTDASKTTLLACFTSAEGEIIIPNNVTSIGEAAFYDCSSLTSVTMPNSITSIGSRAFWGCSGLISVTMPNSILSIGEAAFYDCSSLSSVTIPNKVTSIGDHTFFGCTNLSNVTIPNSVTSIGNRVFENCNSLPVVNNVRYADTYLVEAVNKTLPSYSIKAGTKWIGDWAFHDCKSLTTVTIPNNVLSIGEGAFSGCENLTSVTMPNSIISIGNGGFENCNSLTSINIPNSVTSIGSSTFGNCTSLNSVVIPNGVTGIGYSAFKGCTNLTSIIIPSSVTSIGWSAFEGCTQLFSAGPIGGDYSIQFGWIERIPDNAFEKCINLTDVAIPNSIKRIGGSAFKDCTSLTSIIIPSSVTSIGWSAFEGCTNLQKVFYLTTMFLGNSIHDNSIFYNTHPNLVIYLLNSAIKSIEQYLIERSNWLETYNVQGIDVPSIYVEHAKTDIINVSKDSIEILITPDFGYQFSHWEDSITNNPRNFLFDTNATITAICVLQDIITSPYIEELSWTLDTRKKVLTIWGEGAMEDYNGVGKAPWYEFINPENLTRVALYNGVIHIGNYAFSECGLIESINIPNSVVSIGSYAFNNCSHLEHITLGSEVTTIGDYAFANAPFLLDVTAYMPYPPEINENVFMGCGYLSDIDLYVPAEYEGRYRKMDVWRNFRISTIGAETTPITTNTVQVVPADDNVQITWPVNENASSYTLEITKDGVIVCTLIFNGNGQLTGIAFAPGRNGNAHAPSAMLTEQGFQFTVTGLNPGTVYNYHIDVKDSQDKSIATYNGTFSTNSPEAIDNINAESVSNTNKVLRNGQIFILRGDKTYTLQGQQITL